MISRGNHKMQTCWIYKIFHLRIKDGISYSLMQILKLRYWIFLAPWGQHIKLETQYWHIINLSWQTVVHVQQIWSDISINSELCFCPPEEFMSSIHAPFWSPPTIWLFSCQRLYYVRRLVASFDAEPGANSGVFTELSHWETCFIMLHINIGKIFVINIMIIISAIRRTL